MAYDDIKLTTSYLTADEYNAFVAEMKTRAETSSGAGAPSATPTQLGEVYIDTTNDVVYTATGLASSADWNKLITIDDVTIAASSDSATTVIDLTNVLGTYYDMGSANAATTYTTTGTTLGAFACVLINAASEPTVTGATNIKGSDFIISTDMHMWVQYFGTTVQYFFAEL